MEHANLQRVGGSEIILLDEARRPNVEHFLRGYSQERRTKKKTKKINNPFGGQANLSIEVFLDFIRKCMRDTPIPPVAQIENFWTWERCHVNGITLTKQNLFRPYIYMSNRFNVWKQMLENLQKHIENIHESTEPLVEIYPMSELKRGYTGSYVVDLFYVSDDEYEFVRFRTDTGSTISSFTPIEIEDVTDVAECSDDEELS
jgi:hypothetical protein